MPPGGQPNPSPDARPHRSRREAVSAVRLRSGLVVAPCTLDAIEGTTEPTRAAQSDHEFRFAALTRCRWLSVWLANRRGATLPPISVVQICAATRSATAITASR